MSAHPDPRRAGDLEWPASLRNPLARIELAASRLARDAPTPAARESVAAIRDAVAELDRQIGARSLWERGDGARRPLAEILKGLEQRLRPALVARGIAIAVTPPTGADLTPETWRARRAGLALVRSAARCRPTSIAIRGLQGEAPRRWGIEVAWSGGHSEPAAIAPLRQACADCRGALEIAPAAMRLWFDDGPAC